MEECFAYGDFKNINISNVFIFYVGLKGEVSGTYIAELLFWNVPTMFAVLKTYQMFIYLVSAYNRDYKMTFYF